MNEIEPRTVQAENVLLRKDGKPRSTRRCSRVMKNGERCKKAPIYGGTVCSKHGGRAPHIKAAAKRRIDEALDRAAEALLGMALDDPNMPQSVKLSALKDVLDRGGLSPQQAMQITHELKPYEAVLQKIHRGPRPGSEIEPEIIDAEIVEDDAPACRGCGRQFPAELPPHLDSYPALCRDCRAEMERPASSEPRPSPVATEPVSSAYGTTRGHRDPGATPGGGEYGLMTADEAAALAARTNRRPSRRRSRRR